MTEEYLCENCNEIVPINLKRLGKWRANEEPPEVIVSNCPKKKGGCGQDAEMIRVPPTDGPEEEGTPPISELRRMDHENNER